MKMSPLPLLLAACFTSTALVPAHAAKPAAASQAAGLKVDYQKFTLPNGLDVIFHIDRSDPVVAVNLTAHVGSARERPAAPALPTCSSTCCSWNRKTSARAAWTR